eukprot:766215_1
MKILCVMDWKASNAWLNYNQCSSHFFEPLLCIIYWVPHGPMEIPRDEAKAWAIHDDAKGRFEMCSWNANDTYILDPLKTRWILPDESIESIVKDAKIDMHFFVCTKYQYIEPKLQYLVHEMNKFKATHPSPNQLKEKLRSLQ